MLRIGALVLVAAALVACGNKASKSSGGDPVVGDPFVGGDSAVGDNTTGDNMAGDFVGDSGLAGDTVGGDAHTAALTPSTQFCASGGRISSSNYKGTVCLSPLSSGGQGSSSSFYKLIPGPAYLESE